MESVPKNKIIQFKQDTLSYLRNQYGLDTSKRVNEAIDLFEEWIKKQKHFVKKDFDRGYLERLLIFNKGSVEKCKKKLDKLCTQRTLIPDFFAVHEINKKLIFTSYYDCLFSKMTPDYGRVYFIKIQGDIFSSEQFYDYCKYFMLIHEYIQANDYCNHVTMITDWRESNLMEYVKGMDLSAIRRCCEIVFEGFSMRIKGMHALSNSKTIETIIGIMKQFMSAKIGSRFQVHKTVKSLYKYVPKELFPQEYGGNDKSLSELREDLFNELRSSEFTKYRIEMNKARTNELLRPVDRFNEECLGMSGSFRSLTVD